MSQFSAGLLMIVGAVFFKVSAQLILKLRLNHHGEIPLRPTEFFIYLKGAMIDHRLVLGVVFLVVGAFFWFAALSRLPLSYAFPISSLSYPLILGGSYLLLKEHLTIRMVVGNLLILVGIVLIGISP